jgi:Putative Flp pilus-assembly TadE/G-like
MAMKIAPGISCRNFIMSKNHNDGGAQDGNRGSISILTIGLFLITIALLFLITDIATMAVAKRSLVHATESAALRAVQSLDRAAYYRGDSGVAIPLDCSMARTRVIEELELWMQSSEDLRRPELKQIWLSDFHCEGNRVELNTSARTALPFRLPGSTLDKVELHASASAQSDRAR